MAATPYSVEVGASEHGCDEEKKGTTRDKSRDVVTNLGMLGECVDDLDGHCDGLETEDAEIHSGIKD
ncbi:hypothetical protein PanWU01x14_036400 [Parasponia andersonii]|uniref:Uncharacterized protein n=1 Tax=Parasponia andersonii TaxID=3476 RepID=A0A2P5DSG9_PARAD|nr:hypothetical protein PanWU01x14_036400 [Parasponia andersonii]